MWYAFDAATGNSVSLRTRVKAEAEQKVNAMNETERQPSISLGLARVYLNATDPKLATRTWQEVMENIAAKKTDETRRRWDVAIKDRNFDCIRKLPVAETRPEHFDRALADGKVSSNVYLRRIHNHALGMEWLLKSVIPRLQWPKAVFKAKRAITVEEHAAIVAREKNAERRDFYELLWHTGASQTDAACLLAEDVDWNSRTISYSRAKLKSRGGIGIKPALIRFGSEIEAILKGRPAVGPLFPYLRTVRAGDRATEFRQRCQGLEISGVSLHSYRYAWAERALKCGYGSPVCYGSNTGLQGTGTYHIQLQGFSFEISMKMKISFLLGSGISRPAGLPSVDCITKQVLLPEHFYQDTNEIFRRVASPNKPNPISIVERRREMGEISRLLRWLKALAELRFASDLKRSVNYEDLAYLAAQIRDDAGDEYENPALGPLKCCVLNALPTLCSEQADKRQTLGDFAEKTMNYISDVVVDMLNKPVQKNRRNYLKFFKEAVNDKRFDLVGLFTLNHDTLLETYLRENEVQVIDGFDDENGLGIRRWNPALFDCWRNHADKLTVRLFKLHGSTNWQRFRPQVTHSNAHLRNAWIEEYAGILSVADKLDNEKEERDRNHEVIGRPLFLAGTFNKMLGYLNHVFLELHYNFHRALQESERLIVCGYGFGDKGINNRIIDWMCQPPATTVRRIAIIDLLSFEDFQKKSRGAISGKLSLWKERGQLIYPCKGFGDSNMTWGELARGLLS